jgi:hypothetical protein
MNYLRERSVAFSRTKVRLFNYMCMTVACVACPFKYLISRLFDLIGSQCIVNVRSGYWGVSHIGSMISVDY